MAGEVDADEARLYDLVWKRTVACQMADARGRRLSLRVAATATGGDVAGREAVFGATGRTIEFPGFLRAYVEGADDPDAELEDREVRLPDLRQGEQVGLRGLEVLGHATQPPARYTEASLVKELESRGIGRPSTYAAVLQTIQDRGYVTRRGTALVPSWTAFAVVQLLEAHFAELVDYDFTARMEEDLDAVSRGELEASPWLHAFYFGNGRVGLRRLVEEHLPEIDARAVNSIPIGVDGDGEAIVVRVGRYGPYLQRGDDRATLPEDVLPDELDTERALELLALQGAEARVLGVDPETGLDVTVRQGRYGPYVQLGEAEGDEKPRRASLFASMDPSTVDLGDALRLLSLPRVVGTTEAGEVVTAHTGRFGPYLKAGSEDEISSVTEEEARRRLAEPKRGRSQRGPAVLKDLGPHPDSGEPVRVLQGRYGPYVTDGTVNASVPRGQTPEEVELADAVALLRERAARGPAPARKGAKAGAKKAGVKKSGAKKAGVKKSGAKKAAKKSGVGRAGSKQAADEAGPAGEQTAGGSPTST